MGRFDPLLHHHSHIRDGLFVSEAIGGTTRKFGDFSDKSLIGLTPEEDDLEEEIRSRSGSLHAVWELPTFWRTSLLRTDQGSLVLRCRLLGPGAEGFQSGLESLFGFLRQFLGVDDRVPDF